MTTEDIIKVLELTPLENEGGFFNRVYTHKQKLENGSLAVASAIYYLITEDSFSALHKISSDELFHFYMGDPVEMLMIGGPEEDKKFILGDSLENDERPMNCVPAGTWQGSRLHKKNLGFALLGVSVHPEFSWDSFELAKRSELIKDFPNWESEIYKFTHAD